MAKTLPRINPVLCYLGDAFHLLNEALDLDAEQSTPRARLARSSSQHSLAALHAAANTALWSEEVKLAGDSTLARKFERLLGICKPDEVLSDLELVQLHELELVGQMLNNPQIAQARDFPHPDREDLIEFARTPLKGFSHDVTTWPPEYGGAVLGMVNGFLGNFFRERCGLDRPRIEALLGTHLGSEDSYAARFDKPLLASLKAQEERLLQNAEFLKHMSGSRWKLPTHQFHVTLLHDCWPDAA
jgi:hypothetical protein